MMTTFAIAQNDLAVYAKSRIAIFWTFLGPAICMWFFGLLTPASSGLAPVTIVHQQAQSKVATSLIATLRRDGHSVSEADHVIPGGLSVELRDSGVILHTGAVETEAERSLRYEVEAALSSGAPVWMAPKATSGFQRSVPAYLIMFLTMNLLTSGATFAQERASGRMRRLLTAPISALSVVFGRLSSRLVVAWLQMIVLFSIGVFVLRIQAEHSLGVVLMLSLYVLAMGSVGILIGAYFQDPDQALACAMWGALILAPLTGLWWPIELMPAPLQLLGRVLPTGWVMSSVNAMLASGAGLGQFRLTIVGLITVAAVAIWISTRRLTSLAYCD